MTHQKRIPLTQSRILGVCLAVFLSLVAIGCGFTAKDAIKLEQASSQSAAADNMRELIEYFRTGPRERVTSAYAWRSGVTLSTSHGLASFDPTLYELFFDSLTAPEPDPELRAFKFYCLAELRDPRAVNVLIDAVASIRPNGRHDWECATNALYGVLEMPGVVEGSGEARQRFLTGVSRLRTVAESAGGLSSPMVSSFLLYAKVFEERFKNESTITELLNRVDARTSDEAVLDLLRQANDILVDARQHQPRGRHTRDGLLRMASAAGKLALREGRAGDRAWLLLMEHSPVTAAEALLDGVEALGGAQAIPIGARASRAVDALSVISVLRDLSAAPATVGFFAHHSNGRMLDPRERPRGFDAAALMARLSTLSLGLLSRLESDQEWMRAVQQLVRFERGLAVAQLVEVPNHRLASPSRARLYARTLANLISNGGEGAELWRPRATARMPGLLRIPAHRVPSMVLAAVVDTHGAEMANELQVVMESANPPAAADTVVWDEWFGVTCSVLGKLDAGKLATAPSQGPVPIRNYHALARHLPRASASTQLSVAEFLRLRSPELAARVLLDARKSQSPGRRDVLDSAVARLLSARELTEPALTTEAVNEMLALARSTNEDLALIGARALVENAGETARAAIQRAMAAGTHSGQAVRLVFARTTERWQGSNR